MARIRTIKPDFWTDEKLTECSLSARLLFIGMLNFADDNGNLSASAKKLKMQIFPADNIDCQPLLNELIAQGILIEYSVSGDSYLNIKGFLKHQVINRPSKSSIPQPVLTDDSVSGHGGVIDGREEEGKGREYKKEIAAVAHTSTTVAPVENSTPPTPQGEAVLKREVQFAVLIRKWEKSRGKASKVTSNDKRLIAWTEKGVTDAQLREAYELAVADREIAKDDGPIVPGFIDIFIGKLLNPPAGDSVLNRPGAPAVAKPWQASAPGITAKGLELGIVQGDQENFAYFKERVYAAASMTVEEKSRLRADYGVQV